MNDSMRVLAVSEWNWFPSSLLFAATESFKIEKFLSFLSFSSLSSSNILAVYMYVP